MAKPLGKLKINNKNFLGLLILQKSSNDKLISPPPPITTWLRPWKKVNVIPGRSRLHVLDAYRVFFSSVRAYSHDAKVSLSLCFWRSLVELTSLSNLSRDCRTCICTRSHNHIATQSDAFTLRWPCDLMRINVVN